MSLFNFKGSEHVWFVFNEGGRFLTFTIYRKPFGLRLYLGADFSTAGPRRAWAWYPHG